MKGTGFPLTGGVPLKDICQLAEPLLPGLHSFNPCFLLSLYYLHLFTTRAMFECTRKMSCYFNKPKESFLEL